MSALFDPESTLMCPTCWTTYEGKSCPVCRRGKGVTKREAARHVVDRARQVMRSGDRTQADNDLRHAVHVGIAPSDLAEAFMELGANDARTA